MGLAARPGTRPGGGRRSGRKGYRLVIRDEEWKLYTADIGAEDDFLVRRATHGTPLSTFLNADSFGLDSVGVIQWIARRKRGEKRLKLERVMAELPSFEEIEELVEQDLFILEEFDDDEEGQGDEDALEEGAVPDPLPSAASSSTASPPSPT